MEKSENKNVAVVVMEVTRCRQCPFHKVVPDPDPNDWFEDDDEALLCTHKDCHREYTESQKTAFKRFGNNVTVIDGACRPYEIAKVEVPDFCPLLKK